MRFPKMAKFAIVAIVLLASTGSQSQRIIEETQSAEASNAVAIRDILQKISNGESDAEDDAKLIDIIKKEIVRTAQEIKSSPAGSIEAAARKAQKLVSELTSSYTSAIYKSKSLVDGQKNFARFQTIVQGIVEFIKHGQFLT